MFCDTCKHKSLATHRSECPILAEITTKIVKDHERRGEPYPRQWRNDDDRDGDPVCDDFEPEEEPLPNDDQNIDSKVRTAKTPPTPPMMSTEDVKNLLRSVIAGDVAIELIGATPWESVFSGNVAFQVGDYVILFYRGAQKLNYVDRILKGKHVLATAQGWIDEGADDPVESLEHEEYVALEAILDSLPVMIP